jgi:nicotinamidase/pyrazinamidase
MPTALLIIDVQNDFLPGGALAVPHGDEVIPVINRLIPRFPLVFATQDWHPRNHGSFASNHPGRRVGEFIDLGGLRQILWPDHCVQETPGAAFAPGLDQVPIQHVVRKGQDPSIDSYSGFFDNGHRQSTGLGEDLRARGVKEVYVLGLATDYCVKFTALDAHSLGFNTYVITDGCRGVNLLPGDADRALAELAAAGVRLVTEAEVSKLVNRTD